MIEDPPLGDSGLGWCLQQLLGFTEAAADLTVRLLDGLTPDQAAEAQTMVSIHLLASDYEGLRPVHFELPTRGRGGRVDSLQNQRMPNAITPRRRI